MFQEAAFSKRITEESGVEVIGGADKYMAVCRRCYFSPNNVNEQCSFENMQTQTHLLIEANLIRSQGGSITKSGSQAAKQLH